MSCACRKGAVTPGCPRHSILTPSHRPDRVRGWWHRFLIFASRSHKTEVPSARKGMESS